MLKIIAMGNTLMGDDGIGVMVANAIKDLPDMSKAQFIISETDAMGGYCSIRDGDTVVVLDAVMNGKNPGEIDVFTLRDVLLADDNSKFSVHDLDIIDLMRLYGRVCDGYFIGINIDKVSMSLDLSKEISSNFSFICTKTRSIIQKIIMKELKG